MSQDDELTAMKFKSEAEKKLQVKGCCDSLFGESQESRNSQASELFEKAANSFMLSKRWKDAGECFERSADMDIRLKLEPYEKFMQASHCYSFIDQDSI